MRILVLADNFVPEIAATSFRVKDHAHTWLQQGHEVTVVTCVPNWPHGKPFDGYRNRLYQEEWIDGVRVIRLGTYMAANRGFFRRTLDYISFMLAAIVMCWRYPKFDVILATSPQFFTSVAGWVISILRWRPWIFEVRDLWPESIKAVGASSGRMIRWLERLELFLYRRANRIVTVTNAIKQNIVGRGIDAAKIDVVTNGVDAKHFCRDNVSIDSRARLGISTDVFLAGYIGTTGLAHDLGTIVEAAHLCRDRSDIHFLIMGEGAHRDQLESLARDLGLDNITFADRVSHDKIPSYYAALDVSLVHLKPDPIFETVIPSKIFELMAMEVPIVMAGENEGAKIIREAQCGVCIPAGQPRVLAKTVREIAADRQALPAMGQRGRACVLRGFQRADKAAEALRSLHAGMESVKADRRRPIARSAGV